MTYYRVTFTTPNGYTHTDTFKDWHTARLAYAEAIATYGLAEFTEDRS